MKLFEKHAWWTKTVIRLLNSEGHPRTGMPFAGHMFSFPSSADISPQHQLGPSRALYR